MLLLMNLRILVLRNLLRKSPKRFFLLSPGKFKKLLNKSLHPLVLPILLSVVEDSIDISTSLDSETHEEKGPSSRIKLDHPLEVIVGNMNELTLRKRTVDKCVANFVSYSCYCVAKFVSYSCYLSQVEPTKVEEALLDENWVEAMHDEPLQFQRNDVWTLVPRPEGEHIIGTK